MAMLLRATLSSKITSGDIMSVFPYCPESCHH